VMRNPELEPVGRYGPWERRREAIAATLAEVRPTCAAAGGVGCARENLAADLAGRWVCTGAGGGAKGRGAGGNGLSIGNAILSRWPIAAQAEADLRSATWWTRAGWPVHARIDTPGGALPMFTPT